MALVCLLDLVSITGGRLRLGLMPPREGELTLVQRIVFTPGSVMPGDVLWCLADDCCDAQLAFLRGALGVVADDRIEPWPGGFSLAVDDPVRALHRLAEARKIRGTAKSFSDVLELKVLQLSELPGADIYPLTCGRSAKGRMARRCQRRAA